MNVKMILLNKHYSQLSCVDQLYYSILMKNNYDSYDCYTIMSYKDHHHNDREIIVELSAIMHLTFRCRCCLS